MRQNIFDVFEPLPQTAKMEYVVFRNVKDYLKELITAIMNL